MRSIREVARLHFEFGLSQSDIARSLKIGRATVQEMLRRFRKAGLTWPLPGDLSDTQLEEMLYPQEGGPKFPEPDWGYVHRELRRRGVTLRLLWQEYREQQREGLGYTQFCTHYRDITSQLQVTMRQVHPAGERMMVDYAGMTVPIVDPQTGEIREAQVFVGTLAASGYTYAEATWTQSEEDFINSHVRALAFFAGVTRVWTPDNLKSGVTQADYYDPEINVAYLELARYYGAVIIPARVRRPKDKAPAERSVLLVEQGILAPLRNRQFLSLAQANSAMRPLLDKLNHRNFQRLEESRYSLYLAIDKPALRPLPDTAYEFAHWRKARVNIDYHVEVDRHYYSVPFIHAHQETDVRVTERTVEVFLKGERIASHKRLHGSERYATLDEHMPSAHRRYKNRKPSQLVEDARQIGLSTAALAEAILQTKTHPEQGYRTLLGILRLGKSYPQERMEAAAQLCLNKRMYSSKSLQLILRNGTDRIQGQGRETPDTGVGEHENLRGPGYYGPGAAPAGERPC
jgi:transposase